MGLFKASVLLTLLAVSIGQTLGQYRQSPINIVNGELESINLPPLEFNEGYFVDPDNIKMSVDDFTITLTVDQSTAPAISGGPLETEYVLHSIHFHWGSENNVGSEHRVDGIMFPMEMHAVHVKNGMDIEEAKKLPDGIAVVGYFMQISPTRFLKNNPNVEFFELITENFANLEYINHEISLPSVLSLNNVVVPFKKGFVTYLGSLTTPNYDEAVIWLVAPFPLQITQGQVDAFRGLLNQGLVQSNDNWREPQPLHGRTVYIADVLKMKNPVMNNLYNSLHLNNDLALEKKP